MIDHHLNIHTNHAESIPYQLTISSDQPKMAHNSLGMRYDDLKMVQNLHKMTFDLYKKANDRPYKD